MPIYTYRCRECGHEFDKLRKMSDESVQDCETCGGPVKRVFHPVGIIFKGSGFYSTDNAKKEKTESGKSENSAETKKEGAPAEAKKEPEKSKPDTPKDKKVEKSPSST